MAQAQTPAPEDISFGFFIDRWAQETPDATFAVFDSGESWSYAELRDLVRATASALQEYGVTQGDRVLSWLENLPLAVRVALAVNYLGAVHVPINTAYRGGLLQHVLDLAEARVMIAHRDLVPRLADVDQGSLELVFTAGGDADAVGGITQRNADELEARRDGPIDAHRPAPWDTQIILFTSGTTGPSKAVLTSNQQMFTIGQVACPETSADDRSLIHSPLYHVTAFASIAWALGSGGSVAVIGRFRTSEFWSTVDRLKPTLLVLMGSTATFLVSQPVCPEEQRTTLRQALLAPLTPDAVALCRRVGMRFYSCFNMTETAMPIVTGFNPEEPYTCGVPRAGVQARLVDEHDIEVPRGDVGELILRCDEPWTMLTGYYRNDAATAEAWRNGWFHTGDALRQDQAGNFYYVDRVKDSIRRRGENISSYEVEVEIQEFTGVTEAAVIAVPSELGEDDVMAVVVTEPEATVDPAELLEFLRDRMAHFMIPRYIELVDELPRTPTLKVQKAKLRERGFGDAWDREAAGIEVRRDRLGEPA